MISINNVNKRLTTIIKRQLYDRFLDITEEIKELILAKYDSELVGVVTDRESKTNPIFYRDEFIDRLNNFTYINNGEHEVSLVVPDMETFDFSGRLKVIESIMEGTAGLYVEMDSDDYKAVFNKYPINADSVDNYVPIKERVYLVRYSNKIKRAERSLGKNFVKYPFSNTPPIEILNVADNFVTNNMDSWVKGVIESSKKEFFSGIKGVK